MNDLMTHVVRNLGVPESDLKDVVLIDGQTTARLFNGRHIRFDAPLSADGLKDVRPRWWRR